MGKYLLKYDEFASFSAAQNSTKYVMSIEPGVAYAEDTEQVFYNKIPMVLKMVYLVNDTEYETVLYNAPDGDFDLATISKEMYVDGVKQSSTQSAYTFSTTGLHSVDIVLYDDVESLPSNLFDDYDTPGGIPLVSVAVPEGITNIGSDWFYNWDNITVSSVTFPNSLLYVRRHGGGISLYSEYTSARKKDGDAYYFNTIALGLTGSGITNVSFREGTTYVMQDEDNIANTELTAITFPSTFYMVGHSFYALNANTITFKSKTPPLVQENQYGNTPNHFANSGTYYYPMGTDYSYWANILGSGWTGVES